jgi:hypothetical protein
LLSQQEGSSTSAAPHALRHKSWRRALWTAECIFWDTLQQPWTVASTFALFQRHGLIDPLPRMPELGGRARP